MSKFRICVFTLEHMDWIVDNWPVALAAAGILVIVFGLIKKLIKLAVFGIALIVAAVVLFAALSG